MTEERKFAILFAATILAARRLIDLDPNKPNMAKGFFVDRAIEDAAFILQRRLSDWPSFEPYAESTCDLHRLTYPKDDEACSEIAHLYLSYPKRFPQTSCA